MSNIYELYTTNRDYKISMYLTEKTMSFNKDYKYECHIDFYNNINQKVLGLISSEKEIYKNIQSINEIIVNFGTIYSDIIYFGSNSNMLSHFMYIDAKYKPENSYDLCPLDDDDILQISIYQTDLKSSNKLRLFFECNIDFLQEFIYNLFQLICDLPNFNLIVNKSLEDFMNEIYY